MWTLAILALSLIGLGTTGFMVFDHASIGDAFYTTLMVLLTHYDERQAMDPQTRTIVVILTLSSLGFIAYLLKWLAEYMMGLSDNVRRHRVKVKVDKLKDHYIVCGLGRVGAQIVHEMSHEG